MKASEIIKTTGKEHAMNFIKAGIQAIPVIGGPLGSLISDYLPNYKIERLTKFIEDLSKSVEKLDDLKIDKEYLVSEEFGYLFEKTLKSVNVEYRKEKLEIYKNLLLNFIRKTDTKADEKEYILSIIDGLEIIHIIIFKIFIDGDKRKPSGFGGSISAILTPIFREIGIEETLWKSSIKDLENKGLIKDIYNNLNTMMATPNLENKLTKLGEKVRDLIII